MTDQFAEKESRCVSNSECITQELREWCCSQDSCRTRFMLSVLSLKNEIDSAKAIGSVEIGVTCEEPHVLELDEYTEELLDVFDSISGTRLDPELLTVSRQVELDS